MPLTPKQFDAHVEANQHTEANTWRERIVTEIRDNLKHMPDEELVAKFTELGWPVPNELVKSYQEIDVKNLNKKRTTKKGK